MLAPFEMPNLDGRASRQPDLLFVARNNLDRVAEERGVGPADLAVEVVSVDGVGRDRREKLGEDQAAGIPEYWLIDRRPRQRRAFFHRLGDDGRYVETPPEEDGRYRSAVLPGFWLDPARLWRELLPDPEALNPRIATRP